MTTTTRRHLLRAAALGGVSATGFAVLSAHGATAAAAGQKIDQKNNRGNEHGHDDRPLTGKRANAMVNFGQWDADPAAPFDRQPLNSDRLRNVHRMLPFEAEVDAGGTVGFLISGVHQILIYADGLTLADVQARAGSPPANLPGTPPLVDYDGGDRVYRGLDPRALSYAGTPPANLVQDRVESVNFHTEGRYLVVCGVLPHFLEGMHGYVNVKG